MRRQGLRILHPEAYSFRSPEAKRESLLRAAFLSPDMFESGVVRAHIFPMRPASAREWEALLALSFPFPLGETNGQADVEREFGGILQRDDKVAHTFNRKVTYRPVPGSKPVDTVQLSFLEPVTVRPGEHELTVVLSDLVTPHTTQIAIDVPEIPRKKLMLVGPILGRPAGRNVVVRGTGGESEGDEVARGGSFEPVIVHSFERTSDVLALTQVCTVGWNRAPEGVAIRRSVHLAAGDEAGRLPSEALALDGSTKSKVRCQNLLDVLPAPSMRPGEYVFEVALEGSPAKHTPARKLRFTLESPELDPEPEF